MGGADALLIRQLEGQVKVVVEAGIHHHDDADFTLKGLGIA